MVGIGALLPTNIHTFADSTVKSIILILQEENLFCVGSLNYTEFLNCTDFLNGTEPRDCMEKYGRYGMFPQLNANWMEQILKAEFVQHSPSPWNRQWRCIRVSSLPHFCRLPRSGEPEQSTRTDRSQ